MVNENEHQRLFNNHIKEY